MCVCKMWTIKKAEHWRIDAFELWCWRRPLESPLDSKEIQPVHSKGNQSWIFIGRTDVEAETPILWPPHAKNWLTGKDPDAGKDWMWEEKETTADDGCMASSTQQTWVWVNSRSWWWTGRPGVLPSMGPQRVGHNWVTELNWIHQTARSRCPSHSKFYYFAPLLCILEQLIVLFCLFLKSIDLFVCVGSELQHQYLCCVIAEGGLSSCGPRA